MNNRKTTLSYPPAPTRRDRIQVEKEEVKAHAFWRQIGASHFSGTTGEQGPLAKGPEVSVLVLRYKVTSRTSAKATEEDDMLIM